MGASEEGRRKLGVSSHRILGKYESRVKEDMCQILITESKSI
jgi:hypothetical protein